MLCSIVFVFLCLTCVDSFSFGNKGQECGIEASANLVHHNPWLVLLEYFHRGHLTRTRCGGTLIDSRHIVTAAHCIRKPVFDSIKARLGEYDLETKLECVEGVCTQRIHEIEVEQIFVHPDYDGKDHDIAILRLKTDAPYTDFIRPACLPTGDLKEDTTFVAAGWGLIPHSSDNSRVKKIIPLPYVKTDVCQSSYKSTILPKHIICAGGKADLDTCSGDSGGPLVWIKEKNELWGVISSGNVHCGTEGYPGIYTSVKDHLNWLNDVIL